MALDDAAKRKIYDDLFEFDAAQDAEDNVSESPQEIASGWTGGDQVGKVSKGRVALRDMAEETFRTNVEVRFETLDYVHEMIVAKIKELEGKVNYLTANSGKNLGGISI